MAASGLRAACWAHVAVVSARSRAGALLLRLNAMQFKLIIILGARAHFDRDITIVCALQIGVPSDYQRERDVSRRRRRHPADGNLGVSRRKKK